MIDNSPTLDINNADRDELITLPGVGPAIADRILEARPFLSIEHLGEVGGIGSVLLARLEPFVTFSQQQMESKEQIEESIKVEKTSIDDQILGEEEKITSVEAEITLSAEVETESPQTSPISDVESVSLEKEPPTEDDILSSAVELRPEEEQEITDVEPPSEDLQESQEVVVETLEVERASEDGTAAEEEEVPSRIGISPSQESPPRRTVVATRTKPQPRGVSRGEVLMISLGSSFLAFILAIMLSLAVLLGINGGLRFIRPSEITHVLQQVEGVDTQISTLGQEIDSLRTRVDDMEAVSGRIEAVEEEMAQLRLDMDSLATQLVELDEQVDDLGDEVTKIKARTIVFREFLDSLRDLMADLDNP